MSALWAVLAPEEFELETERELQHRKLRPLAAENGFYLLEGTPEPVTWSAVIWKEVKRVSAPSISAAAKTLRPLARRWELLPVNERRRSQLILEQLREQKTQPVKFPTALSLPEGAGAFTMLEGNEVLWCRSFDRPDPLGRVVFEEDRESAPSRAYLKLWEALSLLGKWPGAGQRAIDLGSSPGGWTWVLASLGAEVLSVDRAPLDPRIAKMPQVEFRKGDAFSVKPEACDWLCSDVICAPEKLLELVKEWHASGKVKHFVCTLKFQGTASLEVVEQFQQLGRVLHLHHNKHELTFLL